MFKFLINIPPSFFAFVSGVFITISTTAIGEIVLSEKLPKNQNFLVAVGIITFFASAFWIVVSEQVSSINQSIDRNAATVNADEWEKKDIATKAIKTDASLRLYILVVLSLILSASWIGAYWFF